MSNLIINAIRNRHCLQFYYDGGNRIVEPFCYGLSTAGNDVLRAFQVAGFSNSGGIPQWRLFDISKAGQIYVTTMTFAGYRPGYNPNDSGMTSIYARV